VIGKGAPTKAGKSSAHGSPLGAEEIAGTRKAIGWDAEPFVVPDPILSTWRKAGTTSAPGRQAWEKRLAALDPARRAEFDRRIKGDLPAGFVAAIADYKKKLAAEAPKVATRKASEMVLEVINAVVPETVGGSADLSPSNNTRTKDMKAIAPGDYSGRFIHWGVREHGMAAAMNGMALHGGLIPYSGTFLVFSDYCRPAIRLAALMGQRVIFVMTHDSIGLGEDGPTHQPVEHLAALRAIPNLNVFRPADATETAECWQLALESRTAPSVIALTRQNLAALRRDFTDKNRCAEGAYEIAAADGAADVTLFASGSEVEIAVAAKGLIEKEGRKARVVSVPSFERFAARSAAERAQVVGNAKVKVAIEAAVRQGWASLIGTDGIFIGMSTFGASGPYEQLYEKFGITAEAAAKAALARLASAA
jgi:transketolase